MAGREDGVYQYHNTTYALDLSNHSSTWREMAPMPTARGSLSCSTIGFRIYYFGGEGNRDNPDRMFNEIEVYNTRTNTWSTLRPTEVPRHDTGVAAIGNAIYFSGGGVTTAFYPSGIICAFIPDFEQ